MGSMEIQRSAVLGWYHALAVSSLPFIILFAPRWLPLLILVILPAQAIAPSIRSFGIYRNLLILCSSLIAVFIGSTWKIAGASLLAAILVAVTAWASEAWPTGRRPDAADFLLTAFIGAFLILHPDSLQSLMWLAPVLASLSARNILKLASDHRHKAPSLGPPDREIRGTLSFSGVIAGDDGLPRSSPLDLEVLSGTSLGLLCDTPSDAALLAEYLAGRRQSPGAQLSLDGIPLLREDHLSVLIAQGEPFCKGDLLPNLEVFLSDSLSKGAEAAIWEACALNEVVTELDGRQLMTDGHPLNHYHRMLVQTARVIPSSYRVLIVHDPMPWVNPVRGGLWRAALLRACLGRTAIVLTADQELAFCMDRIMYFRHGSLRKYDPAARNGE